MKKPVALGFIFMLGTQSFAFADKTAPATEVAGYFDLYYQASPQDKFLAGRAFDRGNQNMVLNIAELSFLHTNGKITLKASLGFGEMVDQLSGGSSEASPNVPANESTRHLTQGTLSYAVSDRVAVTIGKFYSHMGLEVAKAKDNWQYSRSYIYNYGVPFWHQGASVSAVLIPGRLSGAFYVLNAWDGRLSQEQNRKSTLGASLNLFETGVWSMNYNYIGGAEMSDPSHREAHEFNATYFVHSQVAVALDALYGSQKNRNASEDGSWKGLVLIAKYSPTKSYSISPRFEIFDDSDQGLAVTGGFAAPGISQKLTSWTLTNNFQIEDNLEARFELRSDKSDSDQFFKDRHGAPSDHQESLALAVLYSF